MTFCAMARCPRTGALGAAVATFSVNVGRVSPLHRGLTPRFAPNGGMVFVHSSVSLAAGRAALDAFEQGLGLDEVLVAMEAVDPFWSHRQVTVMNPAGEIQGRDRCAVERAVGWSSGG